MIEINLLPDSYKAVHPKSQHNIPINLILLITSGVLIVVLLITSGLNISRRITLGALAKRLEDLAPERQKIISIGQRTSNFRSTNALFSEYVIDKFLWAKKLNAISNLIIPGIWLRNMNVERKTIDSLQPLDIQAQAADVLHIEGTAVSVASDEMGIIGDFVRSLKTDEGFMKDFRSIELEGVLRRRIAEVEVMDFTLICSFKPELKI